LPWWARARSRARCATPTTGPRSATAAGGGVRRRPRLNIPTTPTSSQDSSSWRAHLRRAVRDRGGGDRPREDRVNPVLTTRCRGPDRRRRRQPGRGPRCQAGSAWTGVSGGSVGLGSIGGLQGRVDPGRPVEGRQAVGVRARPSAVRNQVNVVLTPGASETAGNSTFRLVFKRVVNESRDHDRGRFAPAPDLSIRSADNLGGLHAAARRVERPETSPSFSVPETAAAPAAAEPRCRTTCRAAPRPRRAERRDGPLPPRRSRRRATPHRGSGASS
jgi:hypothetical protein